MGYTKIDSGKFNYSLFVNGLARGEESSVTSQIIKLITKAVSCGFYECLLTK
jgi:hypothetical protein